MNAESSPQSQAKDKTLKDEWNVIVWNDPVNLAAYVTYVFRSVYSYTESHAHSLMLKIHRTGKAIVWTGSREHAEYFVSKMHQHQLTATLELKED